MVDTYRMEKRMAHSWKRFHARKKLRAAVLSSFDCVSDSSTILRTLLPVPVQCRCAIENLNIVKTNDTISSSIVDGTQENWPSASEVRIGRRKVCRSVSRLAESLT